jgi:hypothetical protein
LIPITLGILVNKILEKKLKDRFSLLYKKEEIRTTDNKFLDFTNKFFYRFIRRFSLSFVIAIFVTIASGLIETANKHYGFPFPWFTVNVNGILFLTDTVGLYLDFIIFTIIMYILIFVVSCFRNRGQKLKE